MKSSPSARLAASMLGGVALLALAAFPVRAEDAPKPPAVVNGEAITLDDLKIAEEDLAASLPQQLTPAQKQEYLTSYSVDLRIAAAEAEKVKAVSEEDIAKKLAYFRKKIMMEALLTKVARDATTDAAAKKFYDDKVAEIKASDAKAKAAPPEEEIHARHILLENEDDAKKAYERVKGGEDFAKVAKELSKDPGSEGGDLGWFVKKSMVKEFAEAAFALKPGEISQPVKSQFGWHVIKLEERRTKAPPQDTAIPAFDQVKPKILQILTSQAQQALILKLRSEAKIEKPEPPKAAADPAAPATGPAKPADPAPAPAEPPKPAQ